MGDAAAATPLPAAGSDARPRRETVAGHQLDGSGRRRYPAPATALVGRSRCSSSSCSDTRSRRNLTPRTSTACGTSTASRDGRRGLDSVTREASSSNAASTRSGSSLVPTASGGPAILIASRPHRAGSTGRLGMTSWIHTSAMFGTSGTTNRSWRAIPTDQPGTGRSSTSSSSIEPTSADSVWKQLRFCSSRTSFIRVARRASGDSSASACSSGPSASCRWIATAGCSPTTPSTAR